jgi:inner membrane protein
MTAPNHITGGLYLQVYFVVFLINIFASPVFISVTILGSLLPDIDHTKSWIGKSVYPIAKWISRNYGHRTITHSIFFDWYIFDKSIY